MVTRDCASRLHACPHGGSTRRKPQVNTQLGEFTLRRHTMQTLPTEIENHREFHAVFGIAEDTARCGSRCSLFFCRGMSLSIYSIYCKGAARADNAIFPPGTGFALA